MFSERVAWIPCSVSPGMFDSEVAAEINLAGGRKVSFFVDRSLIRLSSASAARGHLRVTVVKNGTHSGTRTVLLPCEAFENGSRWAQIPAEQVEEAA